MRLSIRIHNRAVILKFAVSSIISGSQNTVANHKHAALVSSIKKPLGFRTRTPKLFFFFFFPVTSHKPKLFLTSALTLLSNSDLLSLHILAASTFAGLSSFGSAIMLMTLIKIFSTL